VILEIPVSGLITVSTVVSVVSIHAVIC